MSNEGVSTNAPTPWPDARAEGAAPPRKTADLTTFLPIVGPVVLVLIWDMVVRFGLIKAILLPPPADTIVALISGMLGGPLLFDFWVTLYRTLVAFGIAVALGMPLGIALGSNERAYRSVEFVIDFFRSTPASALIPLFLLIFGTSDINKIAIACFGAWLLVVFNCAYGVINARKQRIAAAKVMGASRWQIFKDVLIWESLQASFVGQIGRASCRESV